MTLSPAGTTESRPLTQSWTTFSHPGGTEFGNGRDAKPGFFSSLLKLMGLSQDLRSALADDSAGSHGVARGNSRQNGAVRDAKPVDTVDLKLKPSSAQLITARLNPCPSFDSLFPSLSGAVQK